MIKLDNGRVVLTRTADFLQWCAWRSWLHVQAGRTFFPEKQVVWSEWPPETQAAADMVIGKIVEARKAISWDYAPAAVPEPWERWPLDKRLDLERRHREDFWWNPALPKSRVRLHTVRDTETHKKLQDASDYRAEQLPKVEKGESFADYSRRVGRRVIALDFGSEPSAAAQPRPTRSGPDE